MLVKQPKPIINGIETNYFECHHCQSIFNYEKLTNSEIEKGCPQCQSKNFELKISFWNGILHYQVKECPTCHKMDLANLINWPQTDKLKNKSQEEVIKIIKQENLNNEDNCQGH